jgi:hypothetical protein
LLTGRLRRQSLPTLFAIKPPLIGNSLLRTTCRGVKANREHQEGRMKDRQPPTFAPTSRQITAAEVGTWFEDDVRLSPETITLIAGCLNDCRKPTPIPARQPYLATERRLIREYETELAQLRASPRQLQAEIAEIEKRIACLKRPEKRRQNAFTGAWTAWAPNICGLFYDTLVDAGRTTADAAIEARRLTRTAVRRVFGMLTDDAIDKQLRKLRREYLRGLSDISRRTGKQK